MKFRIFLLAILYIPILLSACKSGSAEKPDELLGLPPTEKEDPFFFVSLPADAKEANSSGMIGDEGTRTTKKSQCFSCVKICDSEECQDADSICGWGVDYDKENAMLRATAECDGALDLARNDPKWKMVTGICPVATCK